MRQNFCSFPVTDIGTLSFATVGAVGASRPQVETRGMVHTGTFVLVRISPRVVSDLLDIRAAPFFVPTAGRLDQHFQAFLGSGITVHLNVETFQGRLEFS